MLAIGTIASQPHLALPGHLGTAGDLQGFLRMLNQVLQQAGGTAGHAEQVAAGAASASATGPVSGLEASFQRLMQDLALNGAGAVSPAKISSASASSASLQGSLQAQLANLRNIGTAAGRGLMVHASA